MTFRSNRNLSTEILRVLLFGAILVASYFIYESASYWYKELFVGIMMFQFVSRLTESIYPRPPKECEITLTNATITKID